jgi:hypothetical protein
MVIQSSKDYQSTINTKLEDQFVDHTADHVGQKEFLIVSSNRVHTFIKFAARSRHGHKWKCRSLPKIHGGAKESKCFFDLYTISPQIIVLLGFILGECSGVPPPLAPPF